MLKIGDQVIEVRPYGLFRETTGTVVKVGRVWATVKFGSGRWVQVDARTLALNGEACGTMYYTPRGLLVKKCQGQNPRTMQ